MNLKHHYACSKISYILINSLFLKLFLLHSDIMCFGLDSYRLYSRTCTLKAWCVTQPLSVLFLCCFSLSLCSLPSHSAAVRFFSLVSNPLPISFVSVLASFLPFFLFSPSFFFLQTPHNQHLCTHSVRVQP